MHTTTEHKLQLIASNQSTHNTLFYVHVSTIGNANSITRKEICYYQSSANVEDLMSWEMTCYKEQWKRSLE